MSAISYKSIIGNGKTGALPVNETEDWGFGIKNIKPVKRSAMNRPKEYVNTSEIIKQSQDHFLKNSKHEYIQQFQRGVNPAVKTIIASKRSGTRNTYNKVDQDRILQEHTSLHSDLYGRNSRDITSVMNAQNKSGQRPSINNDINGKLSTQMKELKTENFNGYKSTFLQPKLISVHQPKLSTHAKIILAKARTNRKFKTRTGTLNASHLSGRNLNKNRFHSNITPQRKLYTKNIVIPKHLSLHKSVHLNILHIQPDCKKKFYTKNNKLNYNMKTDRVLKNMIHNDIQTHKNQFTKRVRTMSVYKNHSNKPILQVKKLSGKSYLPKKVRTMSVYKHHSNKPIIQIQKSSGKSYLPKKVRTMSVYKHHSNKPIIQIQKLSGKHFYQKK